MDGELGAAAGEREAPVGQEERLEAAQALLDRNAEAVFKLNGLALLRRTAGGSRQPPSAEEQALLAQAQRCLQEVATLLPPKILMPAATMQRLRHQLLQPRGGASDGGPPAAAPSASAPPPAGAAPGPRKRTVTIKEKPADALDSRQAVLDEVHTQEMAIVQDAEGDHRQQQMQQLQSLLAQQQQKLGAPAAPAGSGGAAAPAVAAAAQPLLGAQQRAQALQPQQLQQQQASGSLQLLPGLPQAAGTPAASQGSMSGLLGPGGLLAPLGSAPRLAHGAVAPPGGPPLQPQPSGLAASLMGEPLAKEDMFLLSQAYGSMTAEQKEKLAAQPPEVRQYVLRERMRKTKEQLQLLQQQQAAAAGLGGPPLVPPQQDMGWPGAAPGGLCGLAQPAQAATLRLRPGQMAPGALVPPGGGPLDGPQQLQMLQQAQLGGEAAAFDALGQQDPLAQMRLPSLRPGLDFGVPPLQVQQQQQLQMQQQLLYPQQQGMFGTPQLPGGGGGAGGGGAGMPAEPLGGSPFVSLSEVERLEHLRQLKRRQDEWIEQQRVAAAQMGGPPPPPM